MPPEGGRKSGNSGGKRTQHRELAALAAVQHGVFSLRQLQQLGLSANTVQHRAAACRLHRVHQGVYSLVPPRLLSRKGRWLGAVLASGEGAVLSHAAAAALLGLRPSSATKIDITVPGRSRSIRSGIRTHRSITLGPGDISIVDGIPCTTVARTLLDLGDELRPTQLARAFNQAEVLEVLDLNAITEQLERNRTRAAAKQIRRVLADHYTFATPTWSSLEAAMLGISQRIGVPRPESNTFLVLDDGGDAIRVDFLWRSRKLVIETDGWQTHRTRQKFEHDRRTDQRLTLAGWTVIRLTWRQLMNEGAYVERMLASLLRDQICTAA